MDCSQLATKFHFEDTEGNEVKRDQKLETTCDTLFIVEEVSIHTTVNMFTCIKMKAIK